MHRFAIAALQRRDDFEFVQDLEDFGRISGLQGADDHVFAALHAAAAFIEHLKRFAYTARVTEKDFEASAPGATLLQLDLLKQLLRARPLG